MNPIFFMMKINSTHFTISTSISQHSSLINTIFFHKIDTNFAYTSSFFVAITKFVKYFPFDWIFDRTTEKTNFIHWIRVWWHMWVCKILNLRKFAVEDEITTEKSIACTELWKQMRIRVYEFNEVKTKLKLNKILATCDNDTFFFINNTYNRRTLHTHYLSIMRFCS